MEVGGEVWGRADQQEKRKLKGGHAEQWADFSDFEQETVNNSWPSFFVYIMKRGDELISEVLSCVTSQGLGIYSAFWKSYGGHPCDSW